MSAIPEELKDTYQFPTDPAVVANFEHALSSTDAYTKFFSTEVFAQLTNQV